MYRPQSGALLEKNWRRKSSDCSDFQQHLCTTKPGGLESTTTAQVVSLHWSPQIFSISLCHAVFEEMSFNQVSRGAWVGQLVERLTFGISSGHDLRKVRSSPMWGSTLSWGSTWDSFSPSLCLSSHSFSFCLK